MNKREIKARLKTLDKLETQWRKAKWALNSFGISGRCLLCAEADGTGKNYSNSKCYRCSATLAGIDDCNDVLDQTQDKHSRRPAFDAIRKMRKFIENA